MKACFITFIQGPLVKQSPDLIAFLRLNHAKELALASSTANNADSNVSPTNYDLYKNGKVIKRCKEDIVTGPCSVCEAPNSGFHFGAMACAACSAFFRRTIAEKRKYVCRKEGDAHLNCPIDQQHRCYCRACRLQKCLVMGMDPCGVQPHRDSIGAKPQKRRKEVTDSLLKLAENATTVDSPTSTRFLDDTLADHLGKKKETAETTSMKVAKVSPTAQLLTSTNSLAEQLLAFSRTPVVGRNCYNNEDTGPLPIYPHSSTINSVLMVPKQEHISPEPTEHEQNVAHAYDFFHLDSSSSPTALKICHNANGTNVSRSFTPSDRGAFYDPSQNVIDVMVDAYRHLLERRRLIYCPSSIRDILGGTMPPSRPAKFYERVKREKLRVEIAFYVEFLNSIHPFPKLNVDDKVALVKHLSVSFSILEKHYVTMRGGGLQTNRIIHSDGTYTDLDDPDSIVFEVKDVAGERMDNETLNKLFIQPLRDSLLEISGPMYHSNMTDVEFCALIAILLFDPAAPGLDDSVRRIVKDARDKVYHDWFAYYNQLGVEDASQRVGNTMLLLPAVQTTVEKTQESFHLIRVFELFEYDKILDELLDMSGDNY